MSIILKLKKKKAQAAVTDSLFFLVIIVSLCVLMFRYSSNYGVRVQENISNLYFQEYTNSAMKTIFYTTVPLDFDLNLDKSVARDYLIVSIKQDYYPDALIGASEDINNLSNTNLEDVAKYNLFNTIKAIMRPLNSYDYTFYLFNENSTTNIFNFFMIKITDFTEANDTNADYKYQTYYDVGDSKYYLCNPNNTEDVRNVVSKGNKIYSSSIPLTFKVNMASIEEHRINATFANWPATADINSDNLNLLNCNEITFP